MEDQIGRRLRQQVHESHKNANSLPQLFPYTSPLAEDLDKDLGLGGRLGEQNQSRLLNRDGSFNVRRVGGSLNIYHHLLTISWLRFHLLVLMVYVVVNLVFAGGYLLCGPGALSGADAPTMGGRVQNAFFFSVQTLATIGYGKMTPEGPAANALVAMEALVGLLGFALATGLLFARFSRPQAKILYSEKALIAPFHGGRALMFRILNTSSSELSEVSAMLTLGRMEMCEGKLTRRFYTLELERSKVTFLPVQWVIVHPINEASPLHGWTEEQWLASQAEVYILLAGIDETFTQQVHSRSSYQAKEMVWGAKFRDIYGGGAGPDGILRINSGLLHEYDRMELH